MPVMNNQSDKLRDEGQHIECNAGYSPSEDYNCFRESDHTTNCYKLMR